MGLVVGLLLGIGLFLLVMPKPQPRVQRLRPTRDQRTARLLAEAGVRQVTPRQLLSVQVAGGVVVAALVLAITKTFPMAGLLGVTAFVGPRRLLVGRARVRQNRVRLLWPDVVDNLSSAIRAGLSLPEALGALGQRGPEELRPPFTRFAEDYRATGSFNLCLDRLEMDLADPVGDRVVETLRLAREVGGSDIGTVLRTLSQFLREQARTRAELETRQGWTENAAKLALCAPWAVLLLICGGSAQAARAYNSPVGVFILIGGGGVSFLAFLIMKRVGRLPGEPRVLVGASGHAGGAS